MLVLRQVGTMRRQVDHYLARARAAGAVNVLGNRTPVRPVIDDLSRVLSRIHADRGTRIDVDCPRDLAFRGERQDLQEMAAIRSTMPANRRMPRAWRFPRAAMARRSSNCASAMTARVWMKTSAPASAPAANASTKAFPAAGLGLAIVRDIARLYGGSLTLDESPLGGLEARLALPAIA